jgi:glycine/D-amino acid oxidase-like deaminating enzyme
LPVTSAGAVGRRSDTRVAVVGPFGGPRAAWGELLTSAVRRFQTPGVAWELHDDRGNVDLARECALQIVADGGYRAVIGHFNSLGAAAALPIYRSAGIPVLLPLSTGSGLLAGGGGGALRWCAEDRGQLAALAQAAQCRGVPELQATDDGSANGGHLAAAACGLAGLTLPVRRLPAGGPPEALGALMVCGTYTGAAAAANRLHAAGFRGTFFFTDDCAVPQFADLLDETARPAFVARLAGGAARQVEESFAALTGALVADPALTGVELISMVRIHAGLPFTPDGDPDRVGPGDPGHGWEVVPVDELRAGFALHRAPARRVPEADCLVIGTGIIGVATAATIAELGCQVATIGPGPSAPSATRHSGGLIRAYDPDPRVRKLAIRSYRLLWGNPDERIRSYGFRRTGSLVLLNPSDLEEAARGVGELRAAGIDAHLISPAEIRERWRDIAVDDVAGAVWEPGGGYTASLAAASAFRARALRLGTESWYGWVVGVSPHEQGVRAETEWGPVTARTAVIATGSSVPDLRTRSGAAIGPSARVKRIRYGYFDARGRRLPAVADLVTGMWGRPNVEGESYLTGRPVDEWDVPPSGGDSLTPEEIGYIRSGAIRRWPWLADADYLGGRFGTDLYGGDGPMLGSVCADLPIVTAGVFSGSGVRSAPAVAEVVAAAVRALL